MAKENVTIHSQEWNISYRNKNLCSSLKEESVEIFCPILSWRNKGPSIYWKADLRGCVERLLVWPVGGDLGTAMGVDSRVTGWFRVFLLSLLLLTGAWTSTCFLERGRPLCICRSQYFWWGATSLEHLHFLPSVLLHLPGSRSLIFLHLWPCTEPPAAAKKIKKNQYV